MHAEGNIAAEMCLEQPGIDTLEAVFIPTGVPTVGSTRTVMDIARSKQCWLEHGELTEIQNPLGTGHEVSMLAKAATVLALPWGGGSLPLWYSDDEVAIVQFSRE